MANGFNPFDFGESYAGEGGFMPAEDPYRSGGLLQPPTPPQPQGLGLLPLIVGALGSAADPSFGKNFLYGLQMRQGQADNTYRNQLAQYRAQQQGQMFDLRRQEMQRKAEEAAAAQQQAQAQQAAVQSALAGLNLPPEQQALLQASPEARKQFYEQMYAPEAKPSDMGLYLDALARGDTETANRILAYKRAGATTISTGGEPSLRALTPEQGAALGLAPGEEKGLAVNNKGNVVAIPRRSEAPGMKPEQRKARERFDELATMRQSLNDYRKLLSELGTEWSGAGAQRLSGLRSQLLVQLKELDKLGALSGPDMDIIEGYLSDPTSAFANIESAIRGPASAVTFGLIDPPNVGFFQQLDDIDARIGRNMATAQGLMGGQTPAAAQPEQPAPAQGDTRSDDDILKQYGVD